MSCDFPEGRCLGAGDGTGGDQLCVVMFMLGCLEGAVDACMAV